MNRIGCIADLERKINEDVDSSIILSVTVAYIIINSYT